MIKILTGYSGPGGSTEAHSKLCNLFNGNGYECVMYGHHDYHKGKCKGDSMCNVQLSPNDIIIAHFLPQLNFRPPVKKFVLSIHEKNIFPLKNIEYSIYDKIHFIRESQYKWHGIEHQHFFCSNVHDKLVLKDSKTLNVAGVIGNIDPNKKVHVSIQRAIDDGFKKILIYGNVHDVDYYRNKVEPVINKYKDIVSLPTFCDDKQKMYDSISDVYLSSESEVAPYIQGEAMITGTKFHGTDEIMNDDYRIMSDDEILDIWKKELNL